MVARPVEEKRTAVHSRRGLHSSVTLYLMLKLVSPEHTEAQSILPRYKLTFIPLFSNNNPSSLKVVSIPLCVVLTAF